MSCKHSWQQIARIESDDRDLSYEVERCVKCQSERCLRTERSKVKLEGVVESCEPYIKSAYFDINYILVNYGFKELKGVGIENPHALEVAMEMFVSAYVGNEVEIKEG